MVDGFQELKYVLQTLALPVTGQVRLVDDDCSRVAKLAEAFAAAHRGVGVDAHASLTPEQARALLTLDDHLDAVGQHATVPLCSELALRESADWRQVRNMARVALLRFRWSLEIPPREMIQNQHHHPTAFKAQ